ncbi:MAG: PIN domain nuclease [Deltaproteobacteria bacterium]|nr:PIN domain nuclease [Deltaproteobacteria bacterium]MBW1942299.1 PIN domain nuclease [Deltaproteobacteria bacterium]MBW2206904.1 PIN domain nuclease [Deltaproteobacteria bacterium]
MILVDTSVWIEILRDKTGNIVNAFHERIGTDNYVMSRFNQLELLQGAKNQREWEILDDYLWSQYYLEASESTWREAARIYFELRKKGVTINSPVDCCIAQIAMEHGAFLLHRDKDFERISRIRPLEQERFQFS